MAHTDLDTELTDSSLPARKSELGMCFAEASKHICGTFVSSTSPCHFLGRSVGGQTLC